jgi:hypothetical protein
MTQKPRLTFPAPDLTDPDLPEELRETQRALEKIADEHIMRTAKYVDDEITKGVQMRIGVNWSPIQLTQRLHRTIYADGSEIIALDGVPMLHVGPWITRQIGPSIKMVVTRECTHLKDGNDVLPN